MSHRTVIAPFALIAALALPLALPVAAGAAELLTVTGPTGVQTYDLPALEAFELVTFETSTIWTSGVASFEGVPLKALLDAASIEEGSVQATAINDYAIDIPVAEITDSYPIVAYRMNDEVMSTRDKGPLWVIYPFDSEPSLQTEVNYSRSIWQLDRIALKE